MRILHLAYEDPAQPGSGGGAVRTWQIDRRLARRHAITAVVSAYPGARTREEGGLRWVPLGPRGAGLGTRVQRLCYFALLGVAVRRVPHDLLVEDFGAPFGSGGAPLFSREPALASVQWLFARELRAKYHLPFEQVESAGLRLYDEFIAVSDWLGERLRARRPGARVAVIPNGVDAQALSVPLREPQHLLFVGRLDNAQKGCDLLLEIAARVRRVLGAGMPPLLVAGDGADRAGLEARARQADLAGAVHFVGRVDAEQRGALMSAAYAVLMPSRFETFGLVALESLAAGAPLVAFDVGPLQAVARPGGARLAPAFDVEAFSAEVVGLVRAPATTAAREAGRRWAEQYDWECLAARQEQEYARVRAAGRER
jgi:glycosyltransferase involved in cell wall biosynthesis